MNKPIILTTGDLGLTHLSGPTRFEQWFYRIYADYMAKYMFDRDFDSTFGQEYILSPLHVTIPVSSTGTVVEEMLTCLEAVKCSRLHVEFQPANRWRKYSKAFLKSAEDVRTQTIANLRKHLDRSNWSTIIITGLTQDECQDIIDLHICLDVELKFPLIGESYITSKPITVFKRAILR